MSTGRPRSSTALSFVLVLLIGAGPMGGCSGEPPTERAQEETAMEVEGEGDVPFVETPQPVVNKMLELANVTESDTLYDLGSGDGRIVISAAEQYGAHAVGIEIKPDLVEEARATAEAVGVDHLVEFRQGDLFNADLSGATVVSMYLLPSINKKLRPKLFRELDPGTRVVSHDFDMGHWRADTTWTSEDDTIYLWTISENPPPFVDVEK